MKVYLVGGAVRDQQLGLGVKERDWVVVGSSMQEMLELGYQQVGKDFPVFLHPQTKEEYALARMERKSGRGYKGFVCEFSADVTLTEDLKRRDLTINAMALDMDTQTLTDPYGGQADCQNKILRHVSEAFREDPLRLLRLARFAARFPDFEIATETWQLAQEMVIAGELADLTSERVLAEVHKVLEKPTSAKFFEVLSALGADRYLWPFLDLNQVQKYLQCSHGVLSKGLKLVLVIYPQIEDFAERYPLTSEQIACGQLLKKHLDAWKDISQWQAEQWITFFYQIDAYRRSVRLEQLLSLLSVLGHCELSLLPLAQRLLASGQEIPANEVNPENKLQGSAYGQALRQCRIQRAQVCLKGL